MARLKFIFGLIVIVTLAVLVAMQYQAGNSLRAENENLRRQFAELAQLRAENERLSNLVAHADNSLAQEQLLDLLKLRAEVTALRQQTNQLRILREENQRLQALATNRQAVSINRPAKKNPEDALPQDVHPKETWAFRGYASPEATIESMVWALTKGDRSTLVAGFTPEMLADIESHLNGKDFVQEATNDAARMMEFRILDRQARSDDEMVLTVWMAKRDEKGDIDINDNSEDTVFKRIDGQWKVAGPK
jgi:hypothetical protein